MKRKGYTLVELLAVIVILAIIALIAVPIVLGVIDTARKGAAKSSVLGYVKAIENKVIQGGLENKNYIDKDDYVYDEIEVEVKGTRPTGGMYALKTGIVTTGVFCVDGYEVNYAGNEASVVGNCTEEELKLAGSVKLSATSGKIGYLKSVEIEVIENVSGGKLSCESEDDEIATCSVSESDNKTVTVTAGEKLGKTEIKIISEGNSRYKDAYATYEVEVAKANNKLTLSANSGSYEYPTGGTFEVIENLSGGKLSCETEDSKVATCSITGTTVTVTLGEKKGTTKLTIKSEATDEYNAGQAAYVVTTEEGLLSVTAEGYNGVYDGEPHGITVSLSGATIKYGETEGTYDLDSSPTLTNVGEKTVYYEVSKAGYTTVRGSKTIKITKANGQVTSPTSKTLTYTGSAQSLINVGSSTTGTIQYKVGSNGTYSTDIPTATNAGTYDIYYKVVGDENHNDVEEQKITVTINKATLKYSAGGYSGVYDGESHGITVTSDGATIKYGNSSGTYNLSENPKYTDVGEYRVYYQISREGYNEITGSETVVITKAESKITLSANSGSYTYPEGGTFEIVENSSGTELTCETDNSKVATCSISGTTVTVTLGSTKGTATITIKAPSSKNYNAGQAAYVVTTEEGLLSVTAEGYTGVYDGQPHGITVSLSGATIKYGEAEGTYNLDASPTLTNVGEKTVYYEVSKAGYTTVRGSKTIKITKAEGQVTAPTAKTLTYTGESQALVNAGSSTTGTIEYKLGSNGTYSTNIPTGTKAGTYDVYYKVIGDSNHNNVEERGPVKVTIGKAEGQVTAPTAKTLTYTGESQVLVNAGSSTTGTIEYKVGSTGTYSTDIPTGTNVGTYNVYYKVVGDSNHNDVVEAGPIAVLIGKADNTLTLSSTTGNYTYPTGGTFTVTNNTSGGKLSCSSNAPDVATCSVDGNVVTVTPGTTKGDATLTIKSAETANYNEGTAAYLVITAEGLLTVMAYDYNEPYDGSAHGITVTCNGAIIKYGETEGTYNLDASPTLTDVGTKTVYYQVTKAGYATVTGEKTITITKATPTVTAPTAKTLTYNGSAQALVNAGSTTAGTLQYKVGINGTYSATIPTETNAGTYDVYYKAVGNSNYNDIEVAEPVKVTIGKATPIVTAPTAKTLTYTGNAQALVIAGRTTGGTLQYKLSNGTYSATIPTGTDATTYDVYYKVVGDENYKDVTEAGPIKVSIGKADNTLTLSANSGSYTYPDGGTFTVTNNASGGKLSCTSNAPNVAICSVGSDNKTITVTLGTAKGTASLTIKSASTSNYNEGTVSYVATTEEGLLSVTAEGYNGIYDGKPHGITVTASGTTIKYGEAKGTYDLDSSPTLTDVGTKTVYYQVSKAGYTTVTGERSITITKATPTVTAPTAKTLTYTGSAQSLINAGSTTAGTIQYKVGSTGTYSTDIPTGTTAGTYEVYYKVVGNSNYNDVAEAGPVKVTIKKATPTVTAPTAKTLTYTGSAQSLINAGSTTAGTIQYKIGTGGTYSATIPSQTTAGTYQVYYKVVGNSNYNDVAEAGPIPVTIKKATPTVTAPTAKTLTYTGSAQALVNAGSTTGGTLQYKLGSSGTYSATIPSQTTAGTYEVYYKVVGNTNYNDVTEKGPVTVSIGKANNILTLSANTGSYTYPTGGTFTVTKNTSGGTISCTSNNTNIATCSVSSDNKTITVTPGTTKGEATLTIKSAATTNYKEATTSYVTTTSLATLSVTANGYNGKYDGNAHGITVTSSGATIKYGKSSGSYTLTSSPTYTDPGTYTVYYQVTRTGYTTVTGSRQVVITNLLASDVTYTNSNVSSITNVAEALDYLSENLGSCPAGALCSKVKIGDYVSMTPTSTSYTIPTSLTNYSSSQTINPSELKLWRVINIHKSGTIEMVSEYVSSKSVSFTGGAGYNNYLTTLNTIASQYASNYTVRTRYVDRDDSTLIYNVIGTYNAYKVGTTTNQAYWLASTSSSSPAQNVTILLTTYCNNGSCSASGSLGTINAGAETASNTLGYSIRPIVTLKADVTTSSGSGTSGSPWVLN